MGSAMTFAGVRADLRSGCEGVSWAAALFRRRALRSSSESSLSYLVSSEHTQTTVISSWPTAEYEDKLEWRWNSVPRIRVSQEAVIADPYHSCERKVIGKAAAPADER